MKKMKYFLLLPAIALVACSKDTDENIESQASENFLLSEQEDLNELADPDLKGTVSDVYYAGMKIPVEELNGEYVYQGDILFSPNMVTTEPVKLVYEQGETTVQNKSVGRTSGMWPNNTVYYAIDSRLTDQQRVLDAIKHWESSTNLTFVQRSGESNYIYFTPGSGCSSYVGMIGGKQNLILSSSCTTGNTIHEIGHAVGLWHEQSRVDRDSYVTVNYENVQSGKEHNFYTYQQQGLDGDEFTSSLDFKSIMMYGSYSFSSNGKPTLVTKSGSTFTVQRSALSTGDVTGINNMYPYGSGEPSQPVEPVYENGKYYTVHGLYVLRYYNKWYYYTRYGWRTVIYVDGRWEFMA